MSESLSQHDVVSQAIQDMILAGDLGPGDRLPVEADLAETLGVSRSSLREGVRGLVANGVLHTRQGSGTTVTSLEPELLLEPLVFWVKLQAGPDAGHVHVVRRALEVEAAGIAATRLTEDDLAALARVLDEVGPHIEGRHHELALEADLAFHHLIAQGAGNPILAALIDALAQPTLRGRMWRSIHDANRLSATHLEHRAILDALRSHDPTSARAAMHLHLVQASSHATTE